MSSEPSLAISRASVGVDRNYLTPISGPPLPVRMTGEDTVGTPMAKNGIKANGKTNDICSLANLRNESDVEQTFLRPLLELLGYTEDYIKTKATIPEHNIGKKKKPRLYRPDFICYLDKAQTKPVLIIDGKSSSEDANDGVSDAQLYAAVLRRGLKSPKPEQFCIGSNGFKTIVKHHDSNEVSYELNFGDFKQSNLLFGDLKADLSRESRMRAAKQPAQSTHFEFTKPAIPALLAIFEACHNLIWRREKCPPAEAFYEFSKILFVKLRAAGKNERQSQKTRRFLHSV